MNCKLASYELVRLVLDRSFNHSRFLFLHEVQWERKYRGIKRGVPGETKQEHGGQHSGTFIGRVRPGKGASRWFVGHKSTRHRKQDPGKEGFKQAVLRNEAGRVPHPSFQVSTD